MPLATLGWFMAIWIFSMHGFELHQRATHRHTFFKGITKLQRSHWAMMFGHIGLSCHNYWYCYGSKLQH